MGTNGHDMGRRGELLVQRAGDYLMNTWKEVIYHIATRALDHGGIDRLFLLGGGVSFLLQVKTSLNGAADHEDHPGREWYRSIPVIIIKPEELNGICDPEVIASVAERIKEMILAALERVKENPLPI